MEKFSLRHPSQLQQLTIRLVAMVMVFLLAAGPAHAQAGPQAWSGVCVGDGYTQSAEGVATIQGFQCLLANMFSIALTFIGFIGLVMMIYGAFRYQLSGGSKGVETARKTISFAILGLILALSSFFLINILAAFTGVNSILQFSIPDSSKDWTTP